MGEGELAQDKYGEAAVYSLTIAEDEAAHLRRCAKPQHRESHEPWGIRSLVLMIPGAPVGNEALDRLFLALWP